MLLVSKIGCKAAGPAVLGSSVWDRNNEGLTGNSPLRQIQQLQQYKLHGHGKMMKQWVPYHVGTCSCDELSPTSSLPSILILLTLLPVQVV